MTEVTPKTSSPPEETEKIIIPSDEEEKTDTRQLILTIIGYVSIIFIILSLIFPFWNLYNAPNYHFVSLWQGTKDGVPFDYWTVFFTLIYELFAMITNPSLVMTYQFDQIIWSLLGVSLSLTFIILLIRYFWKRKFPGKGFFWASVLLGGLYGVGFAYFAVPSFSFVPTTLYGPTWGLAFGWWALLIGGIIALIRKLYLDKIKLEEEEKK